MPASSSNTLTADFKQFDGVLIEGTDAPIMAPTAAIPHRMGGFKQPSLFERLGLRHGQR